MYPDHASREDMKGTTSHKFHSLGWTARRITVQFLPGPRQPTTFVAARKHVEGSQSPRGLGLSQGGDSLALGPARKLTLFSEMDRLSPESLTCLSFSGVGFSGRMGVTLGGWR